MKNILGNDECSIHVLKSVCALSKSECYKAKAVLENQDQPVGVRIETAVNILNNAIAYVDEIAQKRHLEDPFSDFEFAEQQVGKNGHIPCVMFGHSLYLYSSYSTLAKGHARLCN